MQNIDKIKAINSRLNSDNLDFIEKSVKDIISSVKEKGNSSLKEFTRKFDNYELKDFELEGIQAKGYFEKINSELKRALSIVD